MISTPTPTPAAIREDVLAPGIFADEAAFISIAHGIVTLTFTRQVFDDMSNGSPMPIRKVALRLSLPVSVAEAMGSGVVEYIGKLRLAAAESTEMPAGSPTVN